MMMVAWPRSFDALCGLAFVMYLTLPFLTCPTHNAYLGETVEMGLKVSNFLEGRGKPYFVDMGTLLGAVRTGHNIRTDTDIDLSVIAADGLTKQDVIDAFPDIEVTDGTLVPIDGVPNDCLLCQLWGKYSHVDIWQWKKMNETHYYCYTLNDQPEHPISYRTLDMMLPVHMGEYEGKRMPFPREYEKILEAGYGPDWRIEMISAYACRIHALQFLLDRLPPGILFLGVYAAIRWYVCRSSGATRLYNPVANTDKP